MVVFWKCQNYENFDVIVSRIRNVKVRWRLNITNKLKFEYDFSSRLARIVTVMFCGTPCNMIWMPFCFYLKILLNFLCLISSNLKKFFFLFYVLMFIVKIEGGQPRPCSYIFFQMWNSHLYLLWWGLDHQWWSIINTLNTKFKSFNIVVIISSKTAFKSSCYS